MAQQKPQSDFAYAEQQLLTEGNYFKIDNMTSSIIPLLNQWNNSPEYIDYFKTMVLIISADPCTEIRSVTIGEFDQTLNPPSLFDLLDGGRPRRKGKTVG